MTLSSRGSGDLHEHESSKSEKLKRGPSFFGFYNLIQLTLPGDDKSAYFDSNAYIAIEDSSELNSLQFTYSFWFYLPKELNCNSCESAFSSC